MDLLNSFLSHIAAENLVTRADRLLLAVSGGLDSVVLGDLCARSGFDFAIAHCNFQLRGEESNRDEFFVRDFAAKLNKEIRVIKFETGKYADQKRISIQVAARELRYAWFLEILQEWKSASDGLDKPGYVLTAHHLDDNIETLLMNFFKGTGISGLHGIPPKKGHIVRPLLFARKQELEKYAIANKLSWVEDSSNNLDKYARNYLRHKIIPALTEGYPNLVNSLAENIGRFKDVEILYQQSIALHKKQLLEKKGSEIHIPVLKLKKASPRDAIIYEIIKDYDFSPHQLTNFLELLDSESGKYIQSASHRIIKNRKWLIIAPNDPQQSEHLVINEPGSYMFVNGELIITPDPGSVQALGMQNLKQGVEILDADKVCYPLLLRKWRAGDYFYPLGMNKKKKLARFFIDSKLSKTDKEKIWILECNKKIILILGLRIDDRFKISPQTKNILNIEVRMT
jgi:tRNA(Ile)-lysidine synthase